MLLPYKNLICVNLRNLWIISNNHTCSTWVEDPPLEEMFPGRIIKRDMLSRLL